MKILYCEDCGDIIAPHPTPNSARFCSCRRHAVWWTDPRAGVLRACDTQGSKDGWPFIPRAYILGITNLLLHMEGGMSAEKVEEAIEAHGENYLFKKWRSLIIRIRPGESGDTRWAPLPEP